MDSGLIGLLVVYSSIFVIFIVSVIIRDLIREYGLPSFLKGPLCLNSKERELLAKAKLEDEFKEAKAARLKRGKEALEDLLFYMKEGENMETYLAVSDLGTKGYSCEYKTRDKKEEQLQQLATFLDIPKKKGKKK